MTSQLAYAWFPSEGLEVFHWRPLDGDESRPTVAPASEPSPDTSSVFVNGSPEAPRITAKRFASISNLRQLHSAGLKCSGLPRPAPRCLLF